MVQPASSAVAQEGHAPVGIWSGDWGPTPTERYPVLIDLLWETGILRGGLLSLLMITTRVPGDSSG
jgi:hypothetical protein